jgi:uncharacterized membrane protein HdeD (DUF308 family)
LLLAPTSLADSDSIDADSLNLASAMTVPMAGELPSRQHFFPAVVDCPASSEMVNHSVYQREVIMPREIALPMVGLFTRNWWVVLLRGIAAIIFGLLAFRVPVVILSVLVLLFGIYALVDGLLSLFHALSGWSHLEHRWLLVFEGLIGIWAGFVTLRAPGITTVALVFFIAIWALVTGVLRIIEAIRLHRETSGDFWLALSGIVSVAFAFLVMLRPTAGALAMIWVIGWYALVMGALLVVASFKLRGLRRPDYQVRITEPPTRRAA